VSAELKADDFKDPRVWQWLCSQAKDVKHGDGEIDVSADKFLTDETIQDDIDGFLEEQSWQHKQEIIQSAVDSANVDSDSDSDKDNDGPCERCGTKWCDGWDDDLGNHQLWHSHKDGKEVCRKCLHDDDSDSDDELVGHERVTALLLGTAEPSGNSLHQAIADAVKSQ